MKCILFIFAIAFLSFYNSTYAQYIVGDDEIGIFLNNHGETICMCIAIDFGDVINIDIYDKMGTKVQDISTGNGSATLRRDKKVYFKLNNLPTGKYTISVNSPRGNFNANMIVK